MGRVAFVAGLGSTVARLIFISSAFAQEPAPAAFLAEVERVIVTGSNIPTAQEESSLPVTKYTADWLKKSGANTPVEGLRQLPSFVGNAATENNSNFGSGAASINLRGLGSENVLVLINGRRAFLGSGFGGVDVNLIPISGLQRVEVLKDGASSIYGSDAVAGVVNFILWNDTHDNGPLFEGAEFEIRYGNTTDTDANVRQAWIRGGVTGLDGKVAIFASAEYYNLAGLYARDRYISSTADTSNNHEINVNPNRGVAGLGLGGRNNNSLDFAGRVFVSLPTETFPQTFPTGPLVLIDLSNNQVTPASYRPFDAADEGTDPARFNFLAFAPAIPHIEKSMEYVSGRYNVFGDALQVYGDMLYSHYRQDNALAGAPFAFSPFENVGNVGLVEARASIFNPFGDRLLRVSYRLQQELGNRLSTFDKDWWRWVIGARGEFSFADNAFISRLGYDAGITYERFDDTQTDAGDAVASKIAEQVALNRFNLFIGQNAPPIGVAPTYTTVQVGTTADGQPIFERVPTGDTAPYNNILAAQLSSYLGRSVYHQKDFVADITINARLFPNLWNEGIDVAGGYQRIWEQQHSIPDPVQAQGDQLGFNAQPNFKFRQEVNAWYGEIKIPFVISTMKVPLVYSLEVDYAYRYEEFDDRDLTNPGPHNSASFNNGGNNRVTVRYQPTPDLLLRATWGQSFRSPTPGDLFTPLFQSSALLFDPVTGSTFVPPGGVTFGGNLDVKPEESETWTAGLVYTPKFVPGFTLTADWYQVFTQNLIVSGPNSAQVLLAADPFNPAIRRDPVTNEVLFIEALNNNAGARFVQGVDVTAMYQLPTTNFGRFTFTLGWNHFFTWKAQLGPGLPFHNFRGSRGAAPLTPGGIPNNKGFLRFEWEYKLGPGNLDFVAQGNYIGGQWDAPQFILGNELVPNDPNNEGINGVINPNFILHRRITSYMTLDLQASYEFVRPALHAPIPGYAKEGKDAKSAPGNVVAGAAETGTFWQRMLWGSKVTAGVVNAFDRNPPTALIAFNDNYDTSLYSIRNRFWYVALSKKF
jgi:outer membrane receptor protein involved in Fe transport